MSSSFPLVSPTSPGAVSQSDSAVIGIQGRGQGPALVLIHGSADTPQAWGKAVSQLESSFTVYSPSFPPLPSARPGDLSPPLAIDTDLPWLTALLDHTGARVVAAHSYGALLALRWVVAHPGRLTGLVLGEPIAWGLIRDQMAQDPTFAQLDACVGMFKRGEHTQALGWLINYWNGNGFWEGLPGKVRAGLLAGAPRTAAEVQSGNADLTHSEELSRLRLKVAVLAGSQTTPQSLQVQARLARSIPGAELVHLAGGGHQFLRTHPTIVADCIRKVADGG